MPPCALVAAVLAVGATPCFAESGVSVGVRPGYPGQTAVLPVLTFSTNDVTAAQFDVSYDPARVVLGEVEPAESLTNHVLWSRELSPGVLRVLVFSYTNAVLRTNQAVAGLTFSVPPAERVGSGPVAPSSILLAQPDASALAPVKAKSGAVFVSQIYRNPDNGGIQVFFPSVAGRHYILQATTDFTGWVNLSTNLADAAFIDLLDADGPNYAHRFYRLADYDSLLSGALDNIAYENAGGQASFSFTGWEGRSYEVQASTNLTHWETLGIRSVSNGQIRFQDPDAAVFPKRFYRLKSEE